MRNRSCKCSCSYSCTFISMLISIIIGAIIGVLFYFGFIPVLISSPISFILAAALAIVAGTAIVIGILYSDDCNVTSCLSSLRNPLLAGPVGTFFASIIALSVALAAESVFYAVIVGLTAFFLCFTVATVLCLIGCAVEDER